MIFLRAENNYDTDLASQETGLQCEKGTSKTQQNQKKEADINYIVKQFGLTGQLPREKGFKMPQTGDFTSITDYHTALNTVKEAERNFMMLPVHVRKRFNQNPEEFVAFCLDAKNKDEAIKLGLIEAEKSETVPVEPPANTEPAATAP